MFNLLQSNASSLFRASLVAVMMASGLAVRAEQAGGIELLELKTTLESSARQLREMDAQLAAAKVQVASLTQSLTGANSDASQAREQYEKLRGVLEGLGIGALEGSRDQVQEKLLAALSDLRIVDEQKREVTEALMALSEAALVHLKNSPGGDVASRTALEAALAKSEQVVRSSSGAGSPLPENADLHDVKVTGWKPEAGLTVLDAGSANGVRVGMPFIIYRENQPVAQVLVVDVRKSICGAVVQEILSKGTQPAVGDRGQIDPNRAF